MEPNEESHSTVFSVANISVKQIPMCCWINKRVKNNSGQLNSKKPVYLALNWIIIETAALFPH